MKVNRGCLSGAEEAEEVAPGGLLAVAEDAGAVDACGEPDAEREGGEEEECGEDDLPDGDAEGDAQDIGKGLC